MQKLTAMRRVLEALEVGQELHAEIARVSLIEDVDIGNALLDLYACCGVLANALEVFEGISHRDAVSWTSVIKGYARCGYCDDALNSYAKMKKEGISPNAVTFVCVLKICGTYLFAEIGQKVHHEILSAYYLEYDFVVRNTLIDMYAKCGLLEKAQTVFNEIPAKAKDDGTWNALILGYSQVGDCDKIVRILDNMDKEEQGPDMLTFVGVLTACSHAGLVDIGFLCYNAMHEDYGISASLEHLSCMVDLLGRASQLTMAMAMIQRMPCHPNLVTYHCLLRACRLGQHMEFGQQMFAHAIELDKENGGTYVTMLNMYTDTVLDDNFSILD